MAADPNWLYATIVTSSAAIVAIVGGLITATLLQLTADRNASQARIGKLSTELEALQRQRDDLLSRAHRVKARSLIWSRLDKVLGLNALPAAHEAHQLVRARHIPEPDFAAEWEAISSAIEAERPNIVDDVARFGRRRDDYERWLLWMEQHHTSDDRDVWLAARMYRHMVGLPADAEAESVDMILDQERQRRVEYYENRASNVEGRMDVVQSELHLMRDHAHVPHVPDHLLLGVGILTFLTLVGIALPLLLLPQRPGTLILWQRDLIVGLFLCGLFFVLGYIAFMLAALRRIPGPISREAPVEPETQTTERQRVAVGHPT